MKKIEKATIATGTGTAAAGTAVALGGKAVLWAAFSAGPGAATAGIAIYKSHKRRRKSENR